MFVKSHTQKYLVFVDFDGVLTSSRVHLSQDTDPYNHYPMWSTFDPVVVEFFNKLHHKYEGVRFVWTTSWRNNVPKDISVEHLAYSMWYNAGFRGMFGDPWTVNPDDQRDGYMNHTSRAEEIKHYLENYAQGCKDFVIIDDNDYNFNKVLGIKRFVRTNPDDGMLLKHMKNILALTGNWDKRK